MSKKIKATSHHTKGLRLLVIGGGASGLTAAIVAARAGAQVTILEQRESVGKKLLATGNGRCNYTNTDLNVSKFYTAEEAFITDLLETYSATFMLDFFKKLGVLSRERNGYVYPYTDQATTIRDALVSELHALHVTIHTTTTVTRISPIAPHHNSSEHAYIVETNQGKFTAERIILATGGKAGLPRNASGDGYHLASQLGYPITPLTPALTGLQGAGTFYKKIAGLRVDATVTARINQQELGSDTGEVQLTDYGISGIPVFQISRLISQALAQHTKQVEVVINFLPRYTTIEMEHLIQQRLAVLGGRTMQEFVNGIFKDKLGRFLLETARIPSTILAKDVTPNQWKHFLHTCMEFRISIIGVNDFAKAQVTAGGIPLSSFTSHLESKTHPGLYVTGELLDVDGICGGYNLHFAWATGILAGTHATKRYNEN